MQTDDDARRAELTQIRSGLLISQREMADLMGVPLRTYEDLETGKSTVRPVHINAAKYAAVVAASRRQDGTWPPDIVETLQKAYDHLLGRV